MVEVEEYKEREIYGKRKKEEKLREREKKDSLERVRSQRQGCIFFQRTMKLTILRCGCDFYELIRDAIL